MSNSSRPMDDDHTWTERRLVGRALATLDDDAAARVEAHLGACGHCRQRAAELTAETEADPAARGHLPAAMIARWDRARAQLTGLERQAVQLHLEHCATCRDELRLTGHEPSLAPAGVTSPPGAPEASGAARPLAVQPRPRGARAWFPWLGGGAIGALAMAAALLLMVRPESLPPLARPPAGGTGGTGGTAVETGPAGAAVTAMSLPWVAPGALRGAEVAVQLPAGARELAVAVAAPAGVDPERALHVAVWGPAGTVLAQVELPPHAAASGTAFVLLRTPEPLISGTYRVVVRPAAAAGASAAAGAGSGAGPADTTESFFDLQTQR